jgi:thiopurine S-methyltransferase
MFPVVQRSFWNDRWQAGQIGFHLPQVNPRLIGHAGHLPAPGRVLVPLCGKTHDLAWLAARGHEVWGVEFVEQAARAFFEERGLTPAPVLAGAMPALRHGAITIVVGDLFDLDVAAVGPFPAIYDRAALVAIEPARQREYLLALRRLATDQAHLLLIAFDHDMQSGPPFSVPAAELLALAQDLFTLGAVEVVDVLEAEPRFRQRGATRMNETVWLGRAQPQPLPGPGALER